MGTISTIEKIRFDDKVITESMSPQDVWNLSGKPVRVRTVRWKNGPDTASYTGMFGLTVCVTSDKTSLAVVEALDESWTQSRLLVLNADGSVRFLLPNEIELHGKLTPCNFVGVTESTETLDSLFTAIAVPFTSDPFSITQRASIDAQTGKVISVQQAR